MARTPSTMVELGSTCPDFTLPDTVSGKMFGLEDIASPTATVVMFICNHCPFVKPIQQELVAVAKEFQAKGVSFVAISSNDVEQYPEDSPEKMKELAAEYSYSFPYLYDESQDVARAFNAACTPDFFVYDGDKALAYRGQFDGSRKDNDVPVTGKDLRKALTCLVDGQPVPAVQTPSLGCNIKWKE